MVTNSVFWDEWTVRIPASIGNIRALQTWGMHPKAVKDVNWRWMEQKLAASECVDVGECGLDDKKVFKRQILLAHQLKKLLVLHLRGKPRELPLLSMARLWYSPHWYYTNATRYICTASVQDKLSFSCGIVHSQNCWWVVPG